MKRKAVFLDRDGTLIVDRIYLNDPEKIEYLPGVFSALRLLRDHGYSFLVATNQSGVARGIVQIENLYEIHRKIRADFAREGVDFCEFYYAPYMTDSDHPMRKPNPGMILRGARDYDVDLNQSWMVGDKMLDVEAGHRAGCRSGLVGLSDLPGNSPFAPPEARAPDLLGVAEQIVAAPPFPR
jgi:D-glycero-D-manno-heptose 1,7-bisphosphate phosphatase